MQDPPPAGSVTAEQFRRIRELFEAALDQPAADRRAWLEVASGGDRVLVDHVARMLAATGQRHHLLDATPEEPRDAESVACLACATPLRPLHICCPSCGMPTEAARALHEGRFRSGLFAGRFRIVALQGRGGMGQVYRAHDLELGQLVALKFLTALPFDEGARKRLRTEVRLARQISHPNVCRVYDIGEANGELYLSMEFVGGEDLAALVRRTGRLPVHKAVEVARKLCAGLAAAHARGVLHRDLKPGNIMLDRQGEVRIMDFGLAAVAGHLDASEVRSGTAAYMAPEQLEGREATTRSDIYALGLVLFELFTGKPAFEGRDAAEFLHLRRSHPARAPSTLVPDLEPAIERIIVQCLARDPHRRPASALDVARALPGGDPLAEALAAGETPSPDAVAAAGPDITLQPRVAVAWLVAIGAVLAGILVLTERAQMVSMIPMETSPEVLAAKARELVHSLGYPVRAAHVAYGLRHEQGYLAYAAGELALPESQFEGWAAILRARPSPVSFWYAQSDAPLFPRVANTGAAAPIDSRPAVLEAISVDLDLDGRLLRFAAPLVGHELPAAEARAVDWNAFFTAAGLDLAAFTQADARGGPSTDSAARLAWTGSYPGRSALPVRVEATATASTVTSFQVLFPWTTRDPIVPGRVNYPSAVLLIVIWIAPCFVARLNWRSGRADVRGALRIGTFAFFAHLGALLLNAHDPLNAFVTRPIFWLALAVGTWAAIVYVALEPWARRWWPHAMTGWARVVAGRWRDPMVARDVLVGLTVATVSRCIYLGAIVAAIHTGSPPLSGAPVDAVPGEFVLSHLSGPQVTAANILGSISSAILVAAVFFFLLALLRSVLRNQWLSLASLCLMSYLWTSDQAHFRGEWLPVLAYLAFVVLYVFAALRYGFLAIVVASCALQVIAQSVLTTDFGAWYGRSSLLAALLVGALAVWAFRVLCGRPSLSPTRTTVLQ